MYNTFFNLGATNLSLISNSNASFQQNIVTTGSVSGEGNLIFLKNITANGISLTAGDEIRHFPDLLTLDAGTGTLY